MFRTFYPNEYVDSTYVIDFDSFANKGYRGVIFDIDDSVIVVEDQNGNQEFICGSDILNFTKKFCACKLLP